MGHAGFGSPELLFSFPWVSKPLLPEQRGDEMGRRALGLRGHVHSSARSVLLALLH